MPNTFDRGLRSIERLDNVALVRLIASVGDLEAAFPVRHSLTLTPAGHATVVLDAAALPHQPDSFDGMQIERGLCAIRASGVCMSGAENRARQICAALARAGIALHALSLCDLALSFVVAATDADRALALVEQAVPLAW